MSNLACITAATFQLAFDADASITAKLMSDRRKATQPLLKHTAGIMKSVYKMRVTLLTLPRILHFGYLGWIGILSLFSIRKTPQQVRAPVNALAMTRLIVKEIVIADALMMPHNYFGVFLSDGRVMKG
jgi:hypothetical protein